MDESFRSSSPSLSDKPKLQGFRDDYEEVDDNWEEVKAYRPDAAEKASFRLRGAANDQDKLDGSIGRNESDEQQRRVVYQDVHGDSDDSDDAGGARDRQERKWSAASSGHGGDYLDSHKRSAISQSNNQPGMLNSKLLELKNDANMYSNNEDLVEQIAKEKDIQKKEARTRRRCYQFLIFSLCFILRFFNRLREHFILLWRDCDVS